MKIEDFYLEIITFEVRYDRALLLWDTAGSIWQDLSEKWSNLELKQAEPNVTRFKIDRDYQVTVEALKTSIQGYNVSSNRLDEFARLVSDVLEAIAEKLNVRTYTRVGLRPIFKHATESKEAASELILSMGLVRIPSGKHLNIEGETHEPIYSIRWEMESLGALITIKVEEGIINITVPPYVKEIEDQEIKRVHVVYDIDYYTKDDLSASKLRAKDWIDQIIHAIRRDSKFFLKG